MPELLQFLFSGLTVGAVYALVALGFTVIYNASGVVNFAQGEFVMYGGMITVFAYGDGMPLWFAASGAVAITCLIGIALHRLAIAPARGASVVALIIITIGASIVLRGIAQIVFDKQIHRFPAFTGEDPILIGGAAAIFAGLYLFMTRTMAGKALIATANNRLAAQLVGINVNVVMLSSFALSAAIGAIAGVLITPITLTSTGIGVSFALKGFAAAVLGGMGNPAGALVGGLLLGLIEALTAGYISSSYKDAAAFIVILLVLFFMPGGLFAAKTVERV